MRLIIIYFSLLFCLITTAQTPDNSFGTNGVFQFDSDQRKSDDFLRGAQIQPDGKFIYLTSNNLARYLSIDNLDTTFGQCGKIEMIYGPTNLLLLNNQKIIVYSSTGKRVTCYNSDGSLNNLFGNDGTVQIPIQNGIIINQIIETIDNKIILGGAIHNGTKVNYLLIKLNPNGTLDNSFDFDGIAQFSIGTIQDIGSALAVQSDNKIILTGKSKSTNTNDDFATIRVTNSGTLDMSFGTAGIVITDFSTTTTILNDYPTSITLDVVNNKFYIAGNSTVTTGSTAGNLSLARFNLSDGSIDNTFNSNGKLITSLSSNNSLSGTTLTVGGTGTNHVLSRKVVSILNSNELLLASRNSSTNKFRLTKINLSNLQQNSIEYSNVDAWHCNYLLFSNNNIYFGGVCNITNNTITNYSISRLKYDTNLQFLSLSILNIEQTTGEGRDILQSSNGDYFTLNSRLRVQKITNNGSLDSQFSPNEILFNQFDTFICNVDQNNKIYILEPNGDILRRFNSNGTLDTSFGNSGFFNYPQLLVPYIRLIKVDNNNNIYIAYDYNYNSIGVIKLNYQGQVDTNFGTNGVASYRFNILSTNDTEYASSMEFDNNGNLIIAGAVANTGINKSIFFKIDSSGNLVNSFGQNGKKIIDGIVVGRNFRTNDYIYYKGVYSFLNTLYPDYRKLIRMDMNGNQDLNFGINGFMEDNQLDLFNDFVVIPCDGLYFSGSKNNHFAVIKYNFNGTIDNSFGTNGTYIKPINCSSRINKLILNPNNHLTAIGYNWDGIGDKITLLKIIGLPINSINIPTANTNQSFNSGDTFANLSVTGSNLQWYSSPTGGTPLPLNTVLVNGATYYVSQTVNGCESSRIAITVTQNLSNEDFDISNIILFPNPTNGIFNIKSNVIIEKVDVHNIIGQKLFTQSISSNESIINIEKYPIGHYFVKLYCDGKTRTFKIIKN